MGAEEEIRKRQSCLIRPGERATGLSVLSVCLSLKRSDRITKKTHERGAEPRAP